MLLGLSSLVSLADVTFRPLHLRETRGFRYSAKSDRSSLLFSFFPSHHVMIRASRIIQRKIVFSKKERGEEV